MLSRRNRAVLVSPIINKVVELNNYMIHHGKQAYKIVQHNYIDAMLKDGCTLFRYARRQLLGKDYAKRTVELCEELEAMAYFVAAFRSVNSYFGIMCHCRAWNIQLRIADEVLRKFGNWLYFRVEPGHLICALKKKYTPRRKAEDEIVKLINEARHVSGKNYQRNCRPCAG